MLEMLWEPVDPRRTLRERFGFEDGAAAERWVADTLDRHWGIRVGACERIVMSSFGALAWAGPLLLKWSVVPERFPRLAETARLTGWLQQQGLPVSAPVPARDGRLQIEVDGVSAGVQRVIPGELLDTTDPGQVRAAGALLARLQAALVRWPDADRLPSAEHASTPPADRVIGWLDSGAAHLPAAARDTLRGMVAGAPPDRLSAQPVHFDFRSANILCHGGAIATVLDFDEAQHEHPLVEVARAATLLGTRFHDWGPVSAEVRTEFLGGYVSERPLTPDEAAWLDILVLWQALVWVPAGDDPTGWGPSALSQLAAAGTGPAGDRRH